MYYTVLFVTLTLVISSNVNSQSNNDILIRNLKLFVEGREYFIKGMCYNPVPLGIGAIVNSNNDLLGGGYCSNKTSPYGEVRTTCYDSDFFDGGSDIATRNPQGPANGWFQPVWERDFPIMKALGVNTLRLYNTNPTTKQASVFFNSVIPFPYGKDHVPFMDYAQRFGFKVIFPLIGDYGMMVNMKKEEFKRLLRFQIDEVGNHPALLMWAFGNELNMMDPAMVDLINYYTGFIKQYTQQKWNRKVPVTCAVVDLPHSYDMLAERLHVDVFTTNAGYRGVTFTDLWNGNPVTKGWHHLSCQFNKPVFIGEMGWLSENNAINYQIPNWFNQMWRDLVHNIDRGCIGGAYFEYSDEIYSKVDPLQKHLGVVRLEIDVTNGVQSTAPNAWNPDRAVKKDIIYDAVASGSFNGKPYNMNANPFQLISRAQYELATAPSVCGHIALRQCPGNSPCSGRGTCNGVTGVCLCMPGWGGADCSLAQCPSQCSGRGVCRQTMYPPTCDCIAGWTGIACEVPLPAGSCPNGCTFGNGKCEAGQCKCNPGWLGFDCSFPDISYPSVNTPAPTTTTASVSTTGQVVTPIASSSSSTASSSTTQKLSTTGTTSSTTQKISTTSGSTTTTTQKVSTTTSSTTQKLTSTTTSSTTQKLSTTSSSSTTQKISTTSTSGQSVMCGPGLMSCGMDCYNPTLYQCFGDRLCQIGLYLCGQACYSSNYYSCQNGILVPK